MDGELVINPNSEQRKVSDLDVTVVSTGKKVVMIEAGANEVPNDTMFEAIQLAHEENQKQIELDQPDGCRDRQAQVRLSPRRLRSGAV